MKKINWRYAIGELLIVIVGITIAFALNNWAGNIRDRNEERAYLANIKSDLQHDINQLDSNIAEINNRIKYLKALTPHLFTQMPQHDSMAYQIFGISDPVEFKSMQTTVESMKFSGDMKLITNLELKNKIIEHYNTYTDVVRERDRHANFAKDYLANYYMKNIDYASFMGGRGAMFLEDSYFRNLMFSFQGIYIINLKAQQAARESAQELFNQL